MVQRCPICKTPLWKDHFWRSKLTCPRCGAEFSTTVPWVWFRWLLVLLFVLLAVNILVLFQKNFLFLAGILLVLAISLWQIPKLIRLHQIPIDLSLAEGPERAEEMQLKLKYPEWEPDPEDEPRIGHLSLLVVLAILLLLTLLLFRAAL